MTLTWSHQLRRVRTVSRRLRHSSDTAQRTTSSHRRWTTIRRGRRMFECTDRRDSVHIHDTGMQALRVIELPIISTLTNPINSQNVHARRSVARSDDERTTNATINGASDGHWQSELGVGHSNHHAAANQSHRDRHSTSSLQSRPEVSRSHDIAHLLILSLH